MSGLVHEQSLLGAYVLGVLDADEVRMIEEHLAICADCRSELAELRSIHEMLGDVPAEAFLDGPPEGGDLLLQRTLRRVRSEAAAVEQPGPRHSAGGAAKRAGGWQRFTLVVASVAAIVAAALGSGFVIGRNTAPAGQ